MTLERLPAGYKYFVAILLLLGIYFMPGRQHAAYAGAKVDKVYTCYAKYIKGAQVDADRTDVQYQLRRSDNSQIRVATGKQFETPNYALHAVSHTSCLKQAESYLQYAAVTHKLASFKKRLLYPKHSFW